MGSARMETGAPRIVIMGVNWLGDALFMTPAIRAVRRRHPGAFLACAVPPRCRELLAGNPHLDLVLTFDERGADRGMTGLWRFSRALRAHRFDTCFLFHRSFTRAVGVALAGIPRRIGYATWKRGWLLTTAAPMPPKDTVHKVAFFLNLLAAAGVPSDGLGYDFVSSDEDRRYARQLLQAAGVMTPHPSPSPHGGEGRGEGRRRPIVAMHAGANWDLKRWPPARFARLGDELAERFGAGVVLVGAAGDRPMAEGIAHRMRHPPAILCGQTTLAQLGALFTQVAAVVSNDSGPLHLASAVGARAVGLFGPTNPVLTAPPPSPTLRVLFGSIGCPVPCYRHWCPINLCLRQIAPDDVLEALAPWLVPGEGPCASC
ncbi:MAG: glycosyltransferase family 9 protein [Candidatus Omnitrophica bacterium]|nr:glycosyltransferase family 9 protein [Candidatus Omnitrophota bacterium]